MFNAWYDSNFIFTTHITNSSSSQNELINAEKFHLIGEMAASISHEIRNPLTSTKGFYNCYNQIHALSRNENYISTLPLMASNKQIMFLQII